MGVGVSYMLIHKYIICKRNGGGRKLHAKFLVCISDQYHAVIEFVCVLRLPQPLPLLFWETGRGSSNSSVQRQMERLECQHLCHCCNTLGGIKLLL